MRIVISASNGMSLINFRGELIKEWVKRGHEVVCTSIESEQEMRSKIELLGAKYYCVSGTRTGLNICSGLKMIRDYIDAYRFLKPDLCFLYMGKPIAFGGLAAILCGIKRIVVFVTGLEMAFYSPGIKNIIIRTILKILFRIVHKYSELVFFMNQDDYNNMLRWNLVTSKQAVIVNGSGVDLNHFSRKPMPDSDVVCMVARLVWSKGVREYIEAATIVRQQYPDVRFLLVGGLDESQEAITESELQEVVQKGIVEYCGFAADVRPYLEACTIFVLPSYHEGNGRSIVEAEATGRPIITTLAPGCRETVIDGYNGFLIPPKDGKALAAKICYLLNNRELLMQMADNSYTYCLEKYDVKKVNKVFLEKMGMV